MHERKSETPELTGQQLEVEKFRDKAYSRCFWMLGDDTEAESIEFEPSASLTESSYKLELEYGYKTRTLLTPQNTRRLDTAVMRMSTALKYLAIVFDRVQVAVGTDKCQPSLLNLNSVAIPSEDVTPYQPEFERSDEDLENAIELGLGAGKLILYDVLVDEANQKSLRMFTESPTRTNDLTVKTKIEGVFWSVEKIPEGVCSWLLVAPQGLQ